MPPMHPDRPPRKAATPALRADATPDPYRLPDNIVPTRYQLALDVDMKALSFKGTVKIALNVLADTNTIVLHAAKNLVFANDGVTVEPLLDTQDKVAVTDVTRSEQYATVTITLDKPLKKDQHYTLIFKSFESPLGDNLSGFYKSSYQDDAKTDQYLATTQFESTSAREAFPCFDEPSFKARFEIQITRDKYYTVRSNMPMLKEMPGDAENTLTTVFTTTVPMSTYLLAWVVSDFEKLSTADGTFNTWARKDIVTGGTMSQEVGPKALEEMAKFTGIPFALKKTDQFAIPDFSAGAMENWGLVTYREEYLIKTESTDVRYEQQIATVICHELSHQWTGNLVTLDWWSHTWLNEGFATFFENFICDKIKPNLNLIAKSVTTYAQVAMVNDLKENQHAMSSDVSTPQQIDDIFDRISYSKGGTVIRMFQHILTPEVFQKGLQRYLSVSMFDNGTPEKLFRAFDAEVEIANQQAASDGTAKPVSLPEKTSFASVAGLWTKQAGVPVVTVKCDFKAKKCTLSQKPLQSPSAKQVYTKWDIPITLLTSKSTDNAAAGKTIEWLTNSGEDTVTIDIDVADDADQKEWVVVNPQQTGYYRVMYDAATLDRAFNALRDSKNAKVLDAATRAQFLGDVMGLAEVELLDWTQPARFLKTLEGSVNSADWVAGFRLISTMTDKLANTDVYNSFKIYLNSLTDNTFSTVGLEVKKSDDHNTRHTRYYVAPYACASGNAACLNEAKQLLADMLDGKKKLHVDTALATVCYGVKASDATVFAKVKDTWLATQGPTRFSLAGALACAEQSLLSGLLTEYLAKEKPTMQERVDMTALVSALITQQPDHHRFVFDFLKSNVQRIDKFADDPSVLTNLLVKFIGTVRTPTELTEVTSWVSSAKDGRGAEQNKLIDAALQSADLTWFKKNYAAVAAFIYKETGTEPTTLRPTDPTNNPGPGPGPNPPKPVSTTHTPEKGGASLAQASETTLLALLALVLMAAGLAPTA